MAPKKAAAAPPAKAAAPAPAPAPAAKAQTQAPPPPKFTSRLFFQNQIFQNIRESLHDLPHLFITGPPGSGKSTFLEDMIQLIKLEAPFHLESVLWLSSEKDRGIHTIRDKVNDFCKRTHAKPNSLRWIVIDDADTLPLISQQALRRPMETFSHLTRFLFASRHTSNLIEPLRSRCLTMELEPVSPVDVFPLYMDAFAIPVEKRHPELMQLCIRNFININEVKAILQLYKALTEGATPEAAIKSLESLLPSSRIHTASLVRGLSIKDYDLVRTSITHLYTNGYLLDDILLSLEKAIAVFPNTNPDIRFRILQFIMLGWIYIQQGKEHWLDTMDIVDTCIRTAP